MNIRDATAADSALIHQFIVELAIYEKAEHEVEVGPAEVEASLFGNDACARAFICEKDNTPIGYAVYFYNYSTWLGKNGIYLEDLYVTPEQRGKGAGKFMLQHLAQIATSKGCGRVEWSVLDWNTPAIEFYKSIGAKPQDEWTVYRLTGEALTTFAAS